MKLRIIAGLTTLVAVVALFVATQKSAPNHPTDFRDAPSAYAQAGGRMDTGGAVPTPATPSRDASAQEMGPAFECGSAGYPLWSFRMKNEPTNYNPAGDWAFFWPSPSVVKPVAPKMSKQHTGQGVPSSALNKALVYQTGTFTIVITPCPASGCSKDSTSLQGQTHEMLAIGSEGSVLYGTCHVQQ